MLDVLLILMIPALGALYRIRGGWLTDKLKIEGNVLPRAAFSLGLAAFAAAQGEDWLLLGAAPLVYLGIVFGWFKAADIGRDKDRPRLIEGLIMCGRGLILTTPLGLFLGFTDHGWWFTAWGLALGPLYELALRTPRLADSFNTGMEMGEAYTGMWLGLGLALLVVV